MNKNLNFIWVIVSLVVIIFLQRECNRTAAPQEPPVPEVQIDTLYIYKDTVITKYVTLIKRDTTRLPGDSVFVPDSCYDELKLQYESLAANYSVRNIYRDTLLLDTFGHVLLYDTIQYNRLKQHQYQLSYRIPVVTKTVTVIIPPKRQLYLGGGLSLNTSLSSMNLHAGFLYKTKEDHIYGAHLLTDGTSVPQVGVSSYWKIGLKK
jgi:hypothetical protein